MSERTTPFSDSEKDQILNQIRRAKTAHLRWRAYAMALSSGYEVEEGQLPLQPTDCQFGCWYHGAGQQLAALPEFTAIDRPHRDVHRIYQDIFEQLFERAEPSFWQKLLGSKTSLNARNSLAVEKQLQQLNDASRVMLDALDTLEAAVRERC
ncbi:CZB domain-containing protein [Thalassolituus sp. LLYu03]|uniref:CZB domain-containing protein n=1 Tax=Thalassolituus sp. LLYu03 TaxID=3421656 RepID=UPI003D29270D